jgi:hypothetical protein
MLIPTLPSTWAPSPRHSMDIPIMEIATSKYDKQVHGSLINAGFTYS